jgi:hypothetical protein
MAKRPRFTGLTLSTEDRVGVAEMQTKGQKMTAQRWRRLRVLELLDSGLGVNATGRAAGTYHREVSRVGRRYLDGGLDKALSDEPRPIPPRRLDSAQEAAMVAMVCGPPPEGRVRWTVRLITEEVVRRAIVPDVKRECIRVVLARHDLKPWREKNVVRAGHHA